MSANITEKCSDMELVEKIKKGNKDAFKVLFLSQYEQLIRFCFYRTKNLENSKDLVQELFLKIWLNRSSLDPQKSIKAYLYKILINQIINLSKLSSSHTLLLDNTIIEKSSSIDYSIESKVDFERAIKFLPEKLKITFLLSRVEGFKYHEIADICNISVKAVEKRISKSLNILRKKINF